MGLESWAGSIDLDTPAGRLLRRLVEALPQDRPFGLTIFGSAPLQIGVDAALLSADVDVFAEEESELALWVERAGLGPGQTEFCIQVGSELNFRSSPRWRSRAQSIRLGACTLQFPHPIDILIGKLNRLDEKDLEAFHRVRDMTGHPTETELIEELQMAVDLFRPGFDDEQGGDLSTNCRRLWPLLFGRGIDPRAEIIAPALKRRRAGYGEPGRDYRQELRDALSLEPPS